MKEILSFKAFHVGLLTGFLIAGLVGFPAGDGAQANETTKITTRTSKDISELLGDFVPYEVTSPELETLSGFHARFADVVGRVDACGICKPVHHLLRLLPTRRAGTARAVSALAVPL